MEKIKKIKFNHSKKLTNNLMSVICGRTGAGKTRLLFKMLTTPDLLDYNNLIILTSTPEQSYYQFLKYGFNKNLSKETLNKVLKFYEESEDDLNIEEICEECVVHERNPTKIQILLTDDPNIIEDPTKLKKMKNLIIFDDLITMKDQTIPQMMFTRGRHNNCACIYLSQNFHSVDKLIRRNANFFILFEQNDRSLTELLKDISVGNRTEFKKFTKNIWSKNDYGYVCINLDKKSHGRYFTDLIQ